MDNFTATVVSVGDQTPTSTAMPKKSGVPNGGLIVFLILAVLLSAAATIYLIMSGPQTPAPPLIPQTAEATPTSEQTENPFSDSAVTVNPFDETATDSGTVNPFAEESTNNPFDQFESGTATTSSPAQNPF
jgi:hypothetical protein